MTEPSKPFVNAVYLTATAGSEDKLKDVMIETVGATLATPGNRGFSILHSTETPANFLVIERWDDDRAVHADTLSPELGTALARVVDQRLVASGPSGTRWTRII